MKKIFFLLLFISFVFLSFGQENKDNPTRKAKKISLGLSFSPDYSYRNISYTDNSLCKQYSILNYQGKYTNDFYSVMYPNTLEKPSFGFNVGLRGRLEISKHLSFTSGVYFAKQGYQTKKIDIAHIKHQVNYDFNPNIDTSYNCYNCLEFKYNYYYIVIPIGVQYYFFERGKIKSYISFEESYNRIIDFNVTKINYLNNGILKGTINENELFSPFNDYVKNHFYSSIKLGIQHNISDKFSLVYEPFFSYSTTTIHQETYYRPFIAEMINLWQFGISINFFFLSKNIKNK